MLRINYHQKIVIVLLLVLFAFSISKSQPQHDLSNNPPPDMVLIPGGEFLMGDDEEEDNSPIHKVYVDSFYMDKYEVTNAQYFKFCKQTGRSLPEFWGMKEFHSGLDFPKHPVVFINWRHAEAYAKWAGKRLPTEAEWEYAARAGLVGKDFPNGDYLDSTMANFFSKERVPKGTVPVGSYPPNGYGLYDMAGNVGEWVLDYYDKNYYKNSAYKNPSGPKKGKFVVIRGGGWHSGITCVRVHYRNCLKKGWIDFNLGFRCVKDLR